ncbi:MAG TPA: hypothetical protein VHD56_02985 [Tepidisphaeraceae bacterium]|nr:hypothetical protein [Tepidisphaeraceae bacterium]
MDKRSNTPIVIGPTSRPLSDADIAKEVVRQNNDAAALQQQAKTRIEQVGRPATLPAK